MKQLFSFIAILCMVGTASAQGIDGSAHDFVGLGWNSSGEICQPCHTPHNAQTIANAPLWNHTPSAASYALYSGFDMDATPGQPTGASLLCLSCHDGTIGLDNFGGAGGTAFITGDGLLGTDLSNDHPISIDYVAGDLELHATTATFGTGTIADVLDGGKVQCSSCHDVHDKGGFAGLLQMTNAGSVMCLACHDK
jgi:predicted CXXCH cytochrome family protein